MIFTIRRRMFINIIVLTIPMCLFAWLLMQEVQKQIDFADQEMKGIVLQKPLTNLLHEVHAHKLALLMGESGEKIAGHIADLRNEMNKAYGAVGSSVGFSEQALGETDVQKIGLPLSKNQWNALQPAVDEALKNLSNTADAASIDQHTKLAGAIKAMISRASDGSNLTLDPDLDSYYVMDALSFAIPNSIDDLAGAQTELLTILPHKKGITHEQFSRIEIWKHILDADDTGRVMGSLGIALVEDPNFYGVSPTLARIKPLMEDYDAKNKALLAMLDKVHTPDAVVTEADLVKAFNDSRESLMALFKASQEEIDVLLNTRIASFQAHLKELLLQGGIALLIGFVLFWLISRSIVNPINRLRNVMISLAKGNIDVEVPYTRKRDEIGQMANAVVVFKDNAMHLRKLAKEFEDSVKHVVEIVASAATEMDSASRDLTSRAETSHVKLKELNVDVGNVLQSIQHVSTAGDQLTSAITEISSQVHKSTATTISAVQDASNVKKVAEAMADSAQKVSGIVGIINGIAAKITLLALNATIEAARAGEAGKGFAVVASEVKTLATQTATATAEISNLVGAMQGSSQETLTAISQITSVIDQINQISSIIAAAIEEQGAATKEISGHINQASKRVNNITKNVAEVTESAGHSTAAATQTLQASNELAKQSEHLRSEVTSFLGNLAKAG